MIGWRGWEQDLRVLTNAIYDDSEPPAEVLNRLRMPDPVASGDQSVLARLTVRMTDLEQQVRKAHRDCRAVGFHLNPDQ